MLPDRSVLIGQRLVENAKIEKFKCDILSNFQTVCSVEKLALLLSNVVLVIVLPMYSGERNHLDL